MSHRSNPAKITDVDITGEDGQKLFTMTVTREGCQPETFTDASVHKFGFTEHKEMVPIIQAKPKTRFNQSWLVKVQQKLKSKKDLEEKLGMTSGSHQSPHKRKATKDASGSRHSKK